MPTLAWLLLVATGAVDKEIGWVPEGAVLLPTGEFYCLLGDFYRTQADDCLPFSLLLLGVDFDFEAGYNNCIGTHQVYTSGHLVGWFALKLALQ